MKHDVFSRISPPTCQNKNFTSDVSFTVPLGTEIKYTSTCHYDDEAIEISSEINLRTTLENEAKFEMSTSFSSSAFLGINTLFWSVSGSKKSNLLHQHLLQVKNIRSSQIPL